MLVKKLVEKGVLTPGEAQQLITETKEEVRKEVAQAKSESSPVWAQRIKMKGDYRLRFQNQKMASDNADRGRMRMRLRVGAEGKVNDAVKVGFGLASGSTSDPRSTNQTFQDTWTKKTLTIDYAYAQMDGFAIPIAPEWLSMPWATFSGGKLPKMPLWEPSDMLWDTDLTPEGLAAEFLHTPVGLSNTDLFFNTGIFILDENSNGSDPWNFFFQPGLKQRFTDKMGLKLAFTYYGFKHVKGYLLDYSGGTNTRNAGGKYMYNFDSISPSAELSFKEPLSFISPSIPVPELSVFGEYLYNLCIKQPTKDKNNEAWAAGVKLGHPKISDWGQWDLKYMYKRIARDAWPDTFPDSDFYSGQTNARGHEIVFSYGLGKNWYLALDYYITNTITEYSGRNNNEEKLFQCDLNFKF
jgi:polyhydroxyalkanoate synthesis regulator phasin